MSNGHGGYRQGAGRRPRDYEPSGDQADLASAKARNEAAKADLNELDLRVKSGEYVSRAAVREATATALATLAQTLRSVPDNLERELNIAPDLADDIGKRIDAALDEVADEFEKLGADPEAQGDDLAVSGGEDEDDASDLL